MDFLEQLKAKATLASEKVVETTNTVIAERQQNAEIKRKKNEIKHLQGQIDDLFRIIGIKVFSSNETQLGEVLDFEEEIEAIKQRYAEQLALQEGLNLENQEIWKCGQCGTITAQATVFCPNCGNSKGVD